jgi:pimeloyl-ACP methyl ester carboxylesterase
MTEFALILLPGLDGSGVMFRPLVDHLPPQLRPIVLSYPPDKMLGYDDLLPLVLAALPTESPFILLGESYGGPLALMAAATRPANLRAVILCATFVRNPAWLRAGWLRHLVRPFMFRLFWPVKRVKAMVGGYSTPELASLEAQALAEVRPHVLAHRVHAAMQVNVLQELISCPVPVLYVRGDYDQVVSRRNLSEIVAARPSVQVTHIPSPHMVLQIHPAAAAEAIGKFVSGIA